MEDIVDIIKADYQQFPKNQHYDIYDNHVYFKDPLNEFRGCDRYRAMIALIDRWFRSPQLDLHQIQRSDNHIRTDWTLSWTTPLPWNPRISIAGWSELMVNEQEKVISHIDYWHCSRFDVIKQHFTS
ncbi:MAG: DUF2358 domain-containing protein [Elainellaceae cyanobacterium]